MINKYTILKNWYTTNLYINEATHTHTNMLISFSSSIIYAVYVIYV